MAKRSNSNGIIRDIGIVAVAITIMWIGIQVVFGVEMLKFEDGKLTCECPFYVVVSGSMIPALEINDIIVIQGHDTFEEVEIGDIIVFDRPSDHNRVLVSRVVSITNEDPKTVRTQGDRNPGSMPGKDFPITEDEYIGKVAYIIPQLGYVTQMLQPPVNIILIVTYFGIILGIVQFKHQKFKKILNSEASTLFYYECPKCHSADIVNNPDGSVNCPDCGYRG